METQKEKQMFTYDVKLFDKKDVEICHTGFKTEDGANRFKDNLASLIASHGGYIKIEKRQTTY